MAWRGTTAVLDERREAIVVKERALDSDIAERPRPPSDIDGFVRGARERTAVDEDVRDRLAIPGPQPDEVVISDIWVTGVDVGPAVADEVDAANDDIVLGVPEDNAV